MYGKTTFIHATPNGDQFIGDIARVSNPKAQPGDPAAKLIRYLISHNHWSPFEMVSMCLEFETTRDIGRQILRHRSFSFQEFSGRYAVYEEVLDKRDCRLQDHTNRQNSLDLIDEKTKEWWASTVEQVSTFASEAYRKALEFGVAKECARAVLPEGLVPTRMYMHGTVRSWIHYIKERTAEGVQREHQMLARQALNIFGTTFPETSRAAFGDYRDD